MRPRVFRSCSAASALMRCVCVLAAGLISSACTTQGPDPLAVLENHVDIGRGQLQVGGPFAGVEFHHSRPLPSRVSFYYPVANSIDLSTDYWRRDESMPFSLEMTSGGETIATGNESFPYRATPASVTFEKNLGSYDTSISYRFAETLPLIVVELLIKNHAAAAAEFSVRTRMRPTLRTSHAYDFRDPTDTAYSENGGVFRADYEDAYADSTSLFLANVAEQATSWGSAESARGEDHDASFKYGATLEPGETLRIVQVVGTCRLREVEDCIGRARAHWREDVDTYESRVADYALRDNDFVVDDSVLMRTARWSRSILAADMHYLDGVIVPMPTPAQYNFFFTHDLLLTDLGAVKFDTARVARDLRYLARLAAPDSLLPHAYYWRNGEYVTEYAGSDNWNHLWFVLLVGSYLKHSGDHDTVERLLPMIRQSMRLMRTNLRNGLMHSERPDWWDIGHVYGARAYLTILMIRALRTYAYLSQEFGVGPELVRPDMHLAEEMWQALVDRLWDQDAGYLLNMLDSTTVDRHYYSGSLLASAFGLLDEGRNQRLLESARDVLLDEHIGIRNAMPPDFLDHIDLYRFNGPEVGAPYRYMNGGVWPQGIAWYAMGLLAAGQVDSAKAVLKRYLTLDGIEASPNGQPALFEYRSADPESSDYGQIDKTTFLWAGGWYLNVLYQLAGVRENEWNLWFDPDLPEGFERVEYDLMIHGSRAHVAWSGSGDSFRSVTVDGTRVYSAVMVGPAKQISLERGRPTGPYLSKASVQAESVSFDADASSLTVRLKGPGDQDVGVEFVSESMPHRIEVDGNDLGGAFDVEPARDGYITSLVWHMDSLRATVVFLL